MSTGSAVRPPPLGEPLLSVRDLTKRYGGVRAVDRVTFTVAHGERVALIGPNGAGKTTCFDLLMGRIQPDLGSVTLSGWPLTGLAMRRIWRLGIGRSFQITATFASMTVLENVQMALASHERQLLAVGSALSEFRPERALTLIERVGMLDQAHRQCGKLAYGDLKRVEFALALANDPVLLLMDEPTAGMAPRERGALMELVDRIVRERGTSVLFTEHDMDVVFAHADRILVMDRGELIAQGTPQEVRGNRHVQDVYLGVGANHGEGSITPSGRTS